MNEKKVISLLERKYSDNKYFINNTFIFSDWESDFLVVKRNGYSIEYEIKCSKSDFFNDFKKEKKHQILKNGWYLDGEFEIPYDFRPNKFYYVVPFDLIKVEEIPDYAGLIYTDEYDLKIIKKAPFITKKKFNFKEVLCDKFYGRYIALKYVHT